MPKRKRGPKATPVAKKNAARMRREEETEEETRQRQFEDTVRHSDARGVENSIQAEARRSRNKACTAAARIAESSVQTETRRARNASTTAIARNSESSIQTETRRSRNVATTAIARSTETSAQTETRRSRNAATTAIGRSAETSVQTETRRSRNAATTAVARSAETSAQTETRRSRNASTTAIGRSAETSVQTETRRSRNASTTAIGRETENSVETETRRSRNALCTAAARAEEEPTVTQTRRSADSTRRRTARHDHQSTKEDYLESFDSSANGPLHEQHFTKANMKKFHEDIRMFNSQHCVICKELWPTKDQVVEVYTCSQCKKDRGLPKLFSVENDMVRDLSMVPDVIRRDLRDLSMVEEMLLSPVLPIMTVYRLKSGGNVSRGFVANFRQDSATFIKQIPLTVDQVPILVVRRVGQDNKSADFKVNRSRIDRVGRWLVDNHPGFKHHGVGFNEEQCQLLPENGTLLGLSEVVVDDADVDLDAVDEGPVPRDQPDDDNLPPDHGFVEEHVITGQRERISTRLNASAQPWPTVDPVPINEFEMSGLAQLCFIKLFPTGQGDPTLKGRRRDVKELDASKHLLRYAEKDPSVPETETHPNGVLYYPFAEHPRWSFWMVDRIRRRRSLEQCNVFLKQNPTVGALSMDELKAIIQNGQIESIIMKMYAYTANITGSDSYWSKKRRELEAIMQQKKLGTAFFTFSFADNHWTDLHRLMPGGLVDPKLRYRNIAKNPHLADWYFSERLSIFISQFFKGTLDYEWIWHRYEWQSRTAIHAHGVVRLKNDPGLTDLVETVYKGRLCSENLKRPDFLINHSEEQLSKFRQIVQDGLDCEKRVIAYANTLLTAMNPREVRNVDAVVPNPHPCSIDMTEIIDDDDAMNVHYEALVNCVQRHVCRPALVCRGKVAGKCRFNYPFSHATATSIVFEPIGNTRAVRAKIVYQRNDEFINVHNRTMAHHWLGNVDLQLILDAHAAITYMTKYAAKAEKSGRALQSIIKTVVSKKESTDSTTTAIRSAMIRSMGNRDIGHGECSRILFSGHHCESSFTFVTVSVDLEVQEIVAGQDGSLQSKKNLLYFFSNRKHLALLQKYERLHLDQPNFIEFCRQFQLAKGELKQQAHPEKIVVIAFPSPRNVQPNNPMYVNFCRANFVKYAPWTVEDVTSILDDCKVIHMWEHFEETCSDDLREYFKLDIELSKRLRNADEVLELEQEEEEVEQLQWQLAAGMPLLNQRAPLQDTPKVDGEWPWVGNHILTYTDEQLVTASNWVQNNPVTLDREQLLQELPKVSPEQLNVQQRLWYDMVLTAVETDAQLRLIVNGTAGTGKSFTISAISHALQANALLRCAFTASAAFLVRGSTIHREFDIPVQGSFKEIDGPRLRNLQEKFATVKVVIIDESSMLSLPLFGKIDRRMRQAKNKEELLGGCSFVLVGDPAQLQPVAATPLFGNAKTSDPFAVQGQVAYRSFEDVITLTEIRRQVVEEGDTAQANFIKALSNMRNGESTYDDWLFLQTRTVRNIPDFETSFRDAPRLFPTNDKVNEYNNRKLQALESPITVLNATHPGLNSTKAKNLAADKFRGLERYLYLAVDAKVTITSNIQPASGLLNGTEGTIKDIVYLPGSTPNFDLPDFIVVFFPSYTGRQFFSDEELFNCIPINPLDVATDDYQCHRNQFPFRLAYCFTIHRSQGQTLIKVVVDLGDREVPGLSYVALSRVRHIKDLALFDFSFERLQKIGASVTERKKEEERLQVLAGKTLENWMAAHL